MTDSLSDLPFERLVRKIAPQGRLVRAWSLKGGISAEMTAIEIALPDGQTRKWIVRRPGAETLKRRPQAALAEFRLLQITAAQGLPTPTPVFLDADGKTLGSPGLVIEFIEGRPEFVLSGLDNPILQLAAHLARIHSVDITCLDPSTLARPAKGLADLLGSPTLNRDFAVDEGQIRGLLESAWPIHQSNPARLLHGDYWPGNILWREGQLVAVIDWEDAGPGDPLIDLAISRLDICWIFSREDMQVFTRQYQSTLPIDLTYLPYWDLYAALRLVRLAGANLDEWAAFFRPYGRPDITPQTIRRDLDFFFAQAFDKLPGRRA